MNLRDFSHEDLTHEDFTHEDSMQDDSTRAPGHSDKWYPWHSRAVSCACTSTFTIIK